MSEINTAEIKSRGGKLHKSKKRLSYLLDAANTTISKQVPQKQYFWTEIKSISLNSKMSI